MNNMSEDTSLALAHDAMCVLQQAMPLNCRTRSSPVGFWFFKFWIPASGFSINSNDAFAGLFSLVLLRYSLLVLQSVSGFVVGPRSWFKSRFWCCSRPIPVVYSSLVLVLSLLVFMMFF